MVSEAVARRLALLQDVRLSEADLESITAEFGDFDAALRELEAFAADVEWPSLPMQPAAGEVQHDRR
jgi:hypothetical protein